MYNTQIYYTVTESNILENDTIATQSYTFMDKGQAEARLYSIWAYAANPPEGATNQCYSIYLTEHRHDRSIMLESKVFDYRASEPEEEE